MIVMHHAREIICAREGNSQGYNFTNKNDNFQFCLYQNDKTITLILFKYW